MENTFDRIFKDLKAVYRRQEKKCVVISDEPGKYYLGMRKVREKDGYRLWLGGVEIKKNYVSAHLMPVYYSPGLVAKISPELRKRMQGKACFNFNKYDSNLLASFRTLFDTALAGFISVEIPGYRKG